MKEKALAGNDTLRSDVASGEPARIRLVGGWRLRRMHVQRIP